MNPFDKDYLERRERQIRERYTMRAVSIGMGFASVLILAFLVLGGASAGLTVPLGITMVATGAISGITFMIAAAEGAADKAIQKERAELAAIYAQQTEKPKRKPTTVHLSDDGELVTDDDDESVQASSNGHSQYQSTKK